MRTVHVPAHPQLRLGVLEASVQCRPSPDALRDLLVPRPQNEELPTPLGFDEIELKPVFDAVRSLLRVGGYKPSGRGKPASEFLARVVRDEPQLHSINNLVDINNAVSLHSGLPMSILDADLLVDPIRVQIAAEGTSYVFNPSGQEISTSGLLCVHHRGDEPCANPVKDSMGTKVSESTRRILAFLYAPSDETHRARLDVATSWFAELLERHAGSTEVETAILSPLS